MSKPEKKLQKVKEGPGNVTIDEILALMRAFGFEERRTSDGYIFYHERLIGVMLPRVAIPHGGEKKVKKPYITMCIDAIEILLSQKVSELGDKGEKI